MLSKSLDDADVGGAQQTLTCSSIITRNHHVHVPKPEVLVECETCLVRVREAEFLDHLETHTTKKIAWKAEPDKPHYRRHIKCNICDKIVIGRRLRSHLRKHSSYFNRKCTICGFVSSQAGIRTHMMVHSDERRYQCTDCGASFRGKVTLTAHALKHEIEKNPGLRRHLPYDCDHCKKSFQSKYHLYRHVQMHKTELNHQCAT